MTSLFERVRMGFQGAESRLPSPWARSKPITPAARPDGETVVTYDRSRDLWTVRTNDAEVIALVKAAAAKRGLQITERDGFVITSVEGRVGSLSYETWPLPVRERVQFSMAVAPISDPPVAGPLMHIIETAVMR